MTELDAKTQPTRATDYKYWAFIAYSSVDSRAALRLHRALERYRLPQELVGKPCAAGRVPGRLSPIFIDRAELEAGGSLPARLRDALGESRALVVLCSPSAAVSDWVDREIRDFNSLDTRRPTLPAIANAGPRGDVDDAFPPALKLSRGVDGTTSEIDPMAADFRRGKDGFHDGVLRIVAGILGVGFDSLKRRDVIRRRHGVLVIAALAMVLFAGYLLAADKNASIFEGQAIQRQLDEWNLSVFRHASSQRDISLAAADLRAKLIPKELTDLDTPNFVVAFVGPRVSGAWELGQIVAGVVGAPEATESDLGRARKWMEVLFEPGRAAEANGVPYGWLRFKQDYPQGEAVLWPVKAIADFLERDHALAGRDRDRFLDHLRYAQRAAWHYYSGSGRWDEFPNQQTHDRHPLYVTLTALDAALDVRRAHLPWLDEAGADRSLDLLTDTASYLLKSYDREGNWKMTPGWHANETDRDTTPAATFTLYAYSLLLEAARLEPASIRLPPEMLGDIARRVATLSDTAKATPESTETDQYTTQFIDLKGQPRTAPYEWHLYWFPWALACAHAWLGHLEADHASNADLVAARRTLGALLSVEKSSVASNRGDYYRAENLVRLDLIQ